MSFGSAAHTLQSLRDQNSESDDTIGTVTAVIGVLLVIASVIYLFWRTRNDDDWEEGLIPKDFEPTRENLFEIFVSAACAMIARDPARLYYKFGMVSRYMEQHFPQEYYDFEDSYRFSLKHIVKIDPLVAWCNRYLRDDQRVQLVNFLLQLAIDDGELLEDEKQYIFVLITKLKLNLEDIDPELSAKLIEQHRQSQPVSQHRQHDFYEILGLSASASLQEVKAAYRKLVKMTHPDRYSLESKEVQEEMKSRFQKIQEAYDEIITNAN